jgi:hypothetical protein
MRRGENRRFALRSFLDGALRFTTRAPRFETRTKRLPCTQFLTTNRAIGAIKSATRSAVNCGKLRNAAAASPCRFGTRRSRICFPHPEIAYSNSNVRFTPPKADAIRTWRNACQVPDRCLPSANGGQRFAYLCGGLCGGPKYGNSARRSVWGPMPSVVTFPFVRMERK